MAIAGRVAIVPKGEYSNAVTYDKLDLVMFNNDAYIAKKASTGIEPTNDEYWMLILNNVVAEDLENIINGTTPVGNAKLLNGLTAEEFAKYNPNLIKTADGLIALFESSENGIFFGEASEVTIASARITYARGVYIIQKDNKYGTITFIGNGEMAVNRMDAGTWGGWQNISDGGNADTVGGLHASRFVQNIVVSSENKTDDPNTTEKSRIRTIHANCPTANVEYIIDTTFTDSTANNYERRQTAYGTGGNNVVYNRAKAYGGSWTTWAKAIDSTGGTINGSLELKSTSNDSPEVKFINSIANISIDLYDTWFRTLCNFNGELLYPIQANLANKEVYLFGNKALHTGNSQKVVTSASAPSDTSALWIDTTNKKVKAYIDGAWTAMA